MVEKLCGCPTADARPFDNRPSAWHSAPVIPQAVILLGGKGTRLAAQFPDRPKCLVPVAGRPFLEWQLDWLRKNGVTRVLLAAGHKADVLEKYLASRKSDGLEITLSREPEPLGTGGALKFVEPQLATDPVLVLNGDSLVPHLDFSTQWKTFSGIFHTMEKYFPHCGKIFVAPISDPGRYGTVEFGADGLVAAFREKAERSAGFVNTGIYLLPRQILESIPAGKPVSLETETFPALAAQRKLVALPAPPPLLDMGTPAGLAAMEQFLRK
jgi:D-glycero-alpha-D-manno-heptose 1-phosphate guanylyltransferase